MTTPSIEYATLSPMLIVFCVAVAGVLVEAFGSRRTRYGIQVALSIIGMLAAFVAPGIYVLNDAQARETQAALARADNPARVFAERFEGTLRRIDGDLEQFVAFLPPDALSDAGAPSPIHNKPFGKSPLQQALRAAA